MFVVEEKRRRCLVHLWDANVGDKEDLLLMMLAC